MNRAIVITTTAALTLLSACATPPTPEQIAAADIGSYPSNYEEIVKASMTYVLRDASTAQWGLFTKPKKVWWRNEMGRVQIGWGLCASVNSKNAYGAYSGFKQHAFMIAKGSIIDFEQDGIVGMTNLCTEMAKMR